MKRRNLRKRSRARRTGLFLVTRLLLSASAIAQEGPTLQAISQMRMRQEAEETNVVRVISQPVTVREEVSCAPVERARERLAQVGASEEGNIQTVNVEAGHGEVTIEGNEGEINNSVNVQIVNPDEKRCL